MKGRDAMLVAPCISGVHHPPSRVHSHVGLTALSLSLLLFLRSPSACASLVHCSFSVNAHVSFVMNMHGCAHTRGHADTRGCLICDRVAASHAGLWAPANIAYAESAVDRCSHPLIFPDGPLLQGGGKRGMGREHARKCRCPHAQSPRSSGRAPRRRPTAAPRACPTCCSPWCDL